MNKIEIRKQKQREADHRYAKKHPERRRAKDRKRYLENRESELARNKAYYPSYYEKNKERIKAERRNRLCGITQEWYDAQMLKQDGKCDICKRLFEKTPHVDHDHACCNTRRCCGNCKRALLCDDCNLGLGRFQDKIEVLENAIQYLKKHKVKECPPNGSNEATSATPGVNATT